MKKHLLLPFLFIALFFSACTPDEDVDMPIPEKPDESFEQQLNGDWLVDVSVEWKVDEDGNLYDEKTLSSYDLEEWYTFGGKYLVYRYGDGDVDNVQTTELLGRYILTENSGRHFLSLYENSHAESQFSEITFEDEESMTWRRYSDYDHNGNKQKTVTIIMLWKH